MRSRLVLLLVCSSLLLPALFGGSARADRPTGPDASGPPARCCFALAGDKATGQVVLFGGTNDPNSIDCRLQDTWTWEGGSWRRQRPETSPAPRCASSAYDAARGEVVLWGGSDGYTDYGDTWTWDGADWVERHPATSPPATCCSKLAYDASTQRIVLMTAGVGETWTWDGVTWTKEDPARYPFPRGGGFGMARDEQHVIFFGGETCGEWCFDWQDTWSWNGATWFKRHPRNSPGRRSGPAIGYDEARRRTLLFGGPYGLADTWQWDGRTWAKMDPIHVPPPRNGGRMAYDDVQGLIVMFGGQNDSGNLGDTWTWDGTDWTER
jgi:hypothetical protein